MSTYVEIVLQDVRHLQAADPLPGVEELLRLVFDVDQRLETTRDEPWVPSRYYLLDLRVCRNGLRGVSLQNVPRAERLQRSVGAAPHVVIEVILHVVVVGVVSVD